MQATGATGGMSTSAGSGGGGAGVVGNAGEGGLPAADHQDSGSTAPANIDGGYHGPLTGEGCQQNGVLTCGGAAQLSRLICENGSWVSNGSCEIGQNCNQQNGLCEPIVAQCQGKQPGQQACDGDALGQCGPDLVTFENQQVCTTGCVEFASSAQCVPVTCGDGTVQAPEECDDGDQDNTDDCTNFCTDATCGDGATWAEQEGCDDGNSSNVDDCTNACEAPSCADGFVWAEHERCDDGNAVSSDSCNECKWTTLQVSTGYGHVCAIGGNRALKCWGSSVWGPLGLEDGEPRGDSVAEMGDNLPAINLGTDRSVVRVAAGDHMTCAVLDDDSIRCWGDNRVGQLGLGDTVGRGSQQDDMGDNLPPVDLGSGRTVKKFGMGYAHVCAILDDDSLKCWGQGGYGQLGLGDPDSRGDDPDEMGDALPTVDLGMDRTVLDVSAGGNHTCAVLDNGTVKCWGIHGPLGSKEIFNEWGDDPEEMGDDLPVVDLGTGSTAVRVVSGNRHNCALLDNGTVKCWGSNPYGELGLGDTFDRPDLYIPTLGMGDDLPAVQLGDGRTAVDIAAGFSHTCALLDDGTVKCWGINTNGQLGLGDSDDRGDDMNEMGDALPPVDLGTDAVASEVHADGGFLGCALLTNGALKCWGANSYGALGIGDYYNRGDDPNEMGDDLPPVILTF